VERARDLWQVPRKLRDHYTKVKRNLVNSRKKDRREFQRSRLPEKVWKGGLTITQDELEAGSDMLQKISEGWPRVLSSLKSLIETGKPLETWAGR
jgi:hypothetical protein